jgi:hypothetical protein
MSAFEIRDSAWRLSAGRPVLWRTGARLEPPFLAFVEKSRRQCRHCADGAPAMIDRLVHHAEILALKGDSFRPRDKDLGGPPSADLA